MAYIPTIEQPKDINNKHRILAYIHKHPNSTSADLVVGLGIPRGSATGWLTHLTEQSLVERWKMGRHYFYKIAASDEPVAVPANEVADDMAAKLAKAEAKLAEAEAKLAKAEEKYPDLKVIDYDAYRPALAEFYRETGLLTALVNLNGVCGAAELPVYDKERIRGLIAAMPLMPKTDG